MVRLKLTAQALSERVYNGIEAADRPKQFREIVPEPESVTIGWLVNKLRHRYLGMFRQELPKIKYIKDAEDVDIDVQMTVFDALMNEGAAKRDGLDQQATVKLIFEGGLRIREGSVVPDLSLAKFHFAPPSPPRSFAVASQTSDQANRLIEQHRLLPDSNFEERAGATDQPVPSIERDGNPNPTVQQHGREKELPIEIQDSQAIFEEGVELGHKIGFVQEEEPKSESEELLDGPHRYPPIDSRELDLNRATAGYHSHNVSGALIQAGDREPDGAAGTSHRHLSSIYRTPNPLPSNSHFSLKEVSRLPRQYLQDDGDEPLNGRMPATPPPGAASGQFSRTKSTSSKLARPSCRTSPVQANQNERQPLKPTLNHNVHDAPESEIEDTQKTPMVSLNKKRKLDDGNRSNSPKSQTSKRIDRRASLRYGERAGLTESNDGFSDRHKEAQVRPHTSVDQISAVKMAGSESSRENISVYSDAVTGQEEVDQQLFESTNATTEAIHDSDGDRHSEVGDLRDALIREDSESDSGSSESGKSSAVEDSGPRYAGESGQDPSLQMGDNRQHDIESDSGKENVDTAVEQNVDAGHHGQDLSILQATDAEGDAAGAESLEVNVGTAPSRSSQPLTGRKRVALGLLKETSQDETSPESVESMQSKLEPEEDITKNAGKGRADKRNLQESTESGQSRTQYSSKKSTAGPTVKGPNEESHDLEQRLNVNQQKPTTMPGKRKRTIEIIPERVSTPTAIAEESAGYVSDQPMADVKRTKKLQSTSANSDAANTGLHPPAASTSAQRPTRKPKKKAPPPMVKDDQIRNIPAMSEPQSHERIEKKNITPPRNATSASLEAAARESTKEASNLKTCAGRQSQAATDQEHDMSTGRNGETYRMGLGITSSPSRNRTKQMDPDHNESIPGAPEMSLPKKARKSSTALIPSGKDASSSRSKLSRASLQDSGNEATTDIAKSRKSSSKPNKNDLHVSKPTAAVNYQHRVETASPAPVIPAGMTEESYRKLVSGFAHKPYVTKQEQKQKRTPTALNQRNTVKTTEKQDDGVSAAVTKGKGKAVDNLTKGSKVIGKVKSSVKSAKSRAREKGAQKGDSLDEPPEIMINRQAKDSKRQKKVADQRNATKNATKADSTSSASGDESNQDRPTSLGSSEPQHRVDNATDGTNVAKAKETSTPISDDDSDSEAESESGRFESAEKASVQSEAGKKTKESRGLLEDNWKNTKDNAHPKSSRKTPVADPKDSGFESGVGSFSSKSPDLAKATKSSKPLDASSKVKDKSASTVGHLSPSSSKMKKVVPGVGSKASKSKKGPINDVDSQTAKGAVDSTAPQPKKPKTNIVPPTGKNGLAARLKMQEEQKAAAQAAERKAEAEKQRAGLAQSTSLSSTSSSEVEDSSDEGGSESDAAPQMNPSAAPSNSTKSSHAHLDHKGAASTLKRPFKVPSSTSKTPASEDAGSGSDSDDSDDTEIVKQDRTPPPRKGPPRSLLEKIKRDSKGMPRK